MKKAKLFLTLITILSLHYSVNSQIIGSLSDEWNGPNNLTAEINRTGRVGVGLSNQPNEFSQFYVRSNFNTSPNLAVGIVAEVDFPTDFNFGICSAIRRVNTKAFSVLRDPGNGNFLDTFNVMGDGRIISGTSDIPVGPQMYIRPSNNSLTSNIYSRTTHNQDFRFGIVSAVNRDNTKAFAVLQNQGGSFEDTFNVFGDGNVLATEVRVRVPIFPDYVFEEDYNLESLEDVEKYIKENKHLPNIPTATEVTKNGMQLGDMQVRQMEKIEELYLHIIALEKRIKELEAKQ